MNIFEYLSDYLGVTIEYPQSPHIEERSRTDLDQIDPIFRYYIVPREIQYNVDALKDRLSYFIQCKGSNPSIRLTVPPDAIGVSKRQRDKSIIDDCFNVIFSIYR